MLKVAFSTRPRRDDFYPYNYLKNQTITTELHSTIKD